MTEGAGFLSHLLLICLLFNLFNWWGCWASIYSTALIIMFFICGFIPSGIIFYFGLPFGLPVNFLAFCILLLKLIISQSILMFHFLFLLNIRQSHLLSIVFFAVISSVFVFMNPFYWVILIFSVFIADFSFFKAYYMMKLNYSFGFTPAFSCIDLYIW